MKIFIVGASGLVGSHCMNTFKSMGWDVVGTHLNYATGNTVYFDPLKSSLDNFNLAAFKPDVIIHCGALTNVDFCENNEMESEKSTVHSTRVLTNFSKANNIKLVYISTDYVFDGANGPYVEHSKTNPINVYGQHKLKAEQIVSETENYLIARITNVYGEELRSKNFIARLILMLKNNEETELHLPYDQFATPIYAGDIARMLGLLIKDKKNGVYHLSSTDYFSRYHLGERIKSYFIDNEKIKVKPVSTAGLQQSAKRPLYGGLLNKKFLSEYNDFSFTNVDDFIKKNIK